MIDDYSNLSVLPVEVKSGRDYQIHSALNHFISNDSYPVSYGMVLSNEREIKVKDKVTYIPIYFVIFLKQKNDESSFLI